MSQIWTSTVPFLLLLFWFPVSPDQRTAASRSPGPFVARAGTSAAWSR
ncbi:hypothetical protein [Actinomyces naeslundii]|nr:hypothetical protein [Actinomyces naeslundii]